MTTAKKLMTAEELLMLPDDGKRHELVKGELIEMPPPGLMHGLVVDAFGWLLGSFIRLNDLPFISTSEAGIFIEREPDTVLAADFALISRERIPEPLPDRGYVFGLVPSLVVEVLSPDYPASVANAKTQMWLDAGVRLVLTAHIADKTIVAHRDDGTVQRFGVNDTVTGAPVLPGFTCAVADIFAY
ncbi:MAG: Uma2 family endonuclease [Chloroflexi bacterium]|nr:Uma2 family endonuclease [Chloroflexota bacterium]